MNSIACEPSLANFVWVSHLMFTFCLELASSRLSPSPPDRQPLYNAGPRPKICARKPPPVGSRSRRFRPAGAFHFFAVREQRNQQEARPVSPPFELVPLKFFVE